MQIYILRHGEAASHESGTPDAKRELTPRGKSDVRNVLRLARAAGVKPTVILSSPLLRAQQTAAVAVKVFATKPAVDTKNLAPAAGPQAIWKELGALREVQQVLLAGHEPHVSRLVTFLLEAAVSVDFKKGALIRIDCESLLGPPRGVLKWMLTPRLVRGD